MSILIEVSKKGTGYIVALFHKDWLFGTELIDMEVYKTQKEANHCVTAYRIFCETAHIKLKVKRYD